MSTYCTVNTNNYCTMDHTCNWKTGFIVQVPLIFPICKVHYIYSRGRVPLKHSCSILISVFKCLYEKSIFKLACDEEYSMQKCILIQPLEYRQCNGRENGVCWGVVNHPWGWGLYYVPPNNFIFVPDCLCFL